MDRRGFAHVGVVVTALSVLAACSSGGDRSETPGLEARGTVLTTVKPTRQSLANQISVAGKVQINPVFGIVAPVDGEVRYLDKQPAKTASTRPVWVASIWHDGVPRRVDIPGGSILAGRLLDDHADVTKGMPVVSATHSGYGIVADIDSAMAYRLSGAVQSVRGQIKNGPGPFSCTPLGTIAALPAGTIPAPPPPSPSASAPAPPEEAPAGGSEPTGLRLVCTAPASVRLINGAEVTLSVVTARAANAMVLPVEAVAGVQGHGKVDIVGADKTRRTVDVELGLTDGKVVQIRSGLRGGETIAVPGPDLPTAEPAPGAGGPSGANG